jgi:hypothetical protein
MERSRCGCGRHGEAVVGVIGGFREMIDMLRYGNWVVANIASVILDGMK